MSFSTEQAALCYTALHRLSMAEVAALTLVGLAAVLGYRFWSVSAGLASRPKALARLVTSGVGLGLAVLALNWTRSPEPDVTVSGWPFPVIGSYKLPDVGRDLWHVGLMDSFVAGIAANSALALTLAFAVGWIVVRRRVPSAV